LTRARRTSFIGKQADEIGSWDCDVALIIRASKQPAPQPDGSFRRAAGPTHELPATTQLICEVGYLATRCPECEGAVL
jgi:hypothetical protein